MLYLPSPCSLLLLGRIRKRLACHRPSKSSLVMAKDWTVFQCVAWSLCLWPRRVVVRVDTPHLSSKLLLLMRFCCVGRGPSAQVTTRHCMALPHIHTSIALVFLRITTHRPTSPPVSQPCSRSPSPAPSLWPWPPSMPSSPCLVACPPT